MKVFTAKRFLYGLFVVACCNVTFAQTQLPTEREIDLLAMVKLPDHAILGTWKRLDGALTCEAMRDARLMVPISVKGSYEVSCFFTRRTNNEPVGLIVPVGTSQCLISVDAWGGKYAGLSFVDGKDVDKLVGVRAAIRQPDALANNAKHQLKVSVMENSRTLTVTVSINDRQIVRWKGRAEQLSVHGNWALPTVNCMGVFVYNSIADIHELKLTLKSGGEGYEFGDDWKNPLNTVNDMPEPAVAKQCIDMNGKKYLISPAPMSLPAAQSLAARVNGRLLTISSSKEDLFISEQGRGICVWTAAWRPPSRSLAFRDERNRPIRYFGTWWRGQPDALKDIEWNVEYHTGTSRGWNDNRPSAMNHACIEWGEEYPETQ